MNIYSGLYLDVDLKCEKKIEDFNLPNNIDTILCIGAHEPKKVLYHYQKVN